MPNIRQFNADKYASRNTSENYEVLEDAILELYGYSGAKVLNMFSQVYGLQIFNQKNTASLLEEMGYIELEDSDNN